MGIRVLRVGRGGFAFPDLGSGRWPRPGLVPANCSRAGGARSRRQQQQAPRVERACRPGLGGGGRAGGRAGALPVAQTRAAGMVRTPREQAVSARLALPARPCVSGRAS